MKRFASVVFFFTIGVVLFALWIPRVSAQTISGGLRGIVTDVNGAVVAGATVTGKSMATGIEYRTETSGEGVYRLPRLTPGLYTITVEAVGFRKLEYTNISVTAGNETVVDLQLEPGAVVETVTIEGGGEIVVQKDNVQISTTFDARKLTSIPVNTAGGGLDRIALLVPGVTPGFGNVNSNGVTLSANGNRARANNFSIDGVDNNDLSIGGPNYFVQNPDIVAEFQVITNNFSAEYGRNQGAIVNIVTKSGTNEYHGTAAWYHRNRKLFDSLTNIERRTGTQKDPLPNLFNVFSYTVGGPVVKNRVWFFTGGQFIRNPGSVDLRTTSLAPTPEGIQQLKAAFPNNPAVQYYADYSAFALPIGNPTIRPDVSQSTITVGTTTVPVAAVQRFVTRANNWDEYNLRGDAALTDRHRVWGRFFWQDRPGPDQLVGVGGFTGDIPLQTRQLGGGWNWQLSTRVFNEFRVNYSRLFVIFGGGNTGGKGQIPHPDEIDKALTFLNLAGFRAANGSALLNVGPATNLPQGRTVESYQFANNLVLTFGRHQMKTGFDFRKLENKVPFLPNVNGAYLFADGTRLGANNPNSLTVALGPATLVYDEFDQFYYFQDDWRIRENLTLNLGVRYENTGQPINLLNDITRARESSNNAFWRQNLDLSARTTPRIPTDSNNWAPRLGFVYTPRWGRWFFGENKSVISGGFGIAYDATFYNLMLNISTSAPIVFLTTVSGIGVPSNVPTGDVVRNAAVQAGVIAFNTFNPEYFVRTTVNPKFRSPYGEQWSLRFQREIGRSYVFEARYVGTHGVGLFQTINANPFIGNLVNGFSRQARLETADGTVTTINFPSFANLLPSTARPLTCTDNPATRDNEAACNGRLFPFGVARERINGAQSIYHGLQTRFETRLSDQLFGGFTYTWSHAIDNSSEVFSFDGGNSVAVAQNPLDITRAERGNSGFDARHVFTLNWVWYIPVAREQRGVLGRILGGWQANGVFRLQTQRLFTPTHANSARNPYEDSTFMASFFGSQSHFRPFSGNPNAPKDRVAITDIDACVFYGFCGTGTGNLPILRQSPTGFWLLNDLNRTPRVFTPVTINDVRFIVNGAGAALRFGTPFGNIGRNTFPGDRIESFDFSIFKTTRITEQVKIQYQLNLFNALNHPNFGIPNNITLDQAGRTFFNFQENDGSFSLLNNGRRTIEMALKIIF